MLIRALVSLAGATFVFVCSCFSAPMIIAVFVMAIATVLNASLPTAAVALVLIVALLILGTELLITYLWEACHDKYVQYVAKGRRRTGIQEAGRAGFEPDHLGASAAAARAAA